MHVVTIKSSWYKSYLKLSTFPAARSNNLPIQWNKTSLSPPPGPVICLTELSREILFTVNIVFTNSIQTVNSLL